VSLPDTMRAMVTTGHGGFEKLSYRTDWPRPDPGPGEVLVKVGACGLNNTDINTREGWYSKAVTGATGSTPRRGAGGRGSVLGRRAHRLSAHPGRRCVRPDRGRGRGVDPARIGERVITDNWLRDPDDLTDKTKTGYFGSECDGGFAEYATMPARNALAVNSPLSDAELATFSCSYSTAEGMLTRARVTDADTRS
jgi:NADPH:quinone reductase-like Zn-dependent oxidoreductase